MKSLILTLALCGFVLSAPAMDIIYANNFNIGWEGMQNVNILGNQNWVRNTGTFGINNSPCIQISGFFDSTNNVNENWLVTPPMNFDNYTGHTLAFSNLVRYAGDPLALLISSDYSGTGDIYNATWTDITDRAHWATDPGFWQWDTSGNIDISDFSGESVFIAFKYTSDTDAAAYWRLDDLSIRGNATMTLVAGLVEPTGMLVSTPDQQVAFTSVSISNGTAQIGYGRSRDDFFWTWVDATVTGDGPYVAHATLTASPTPDVVFYAAKWDIDGTVIYAWNKDGQTNQLALAAEYPWVVRAHNILYENNFNLDWLGMTRYSVTGEQNWVLSPTFGVNNSGHARMSGFVSMPLLNEAWLITPSMDFTLYPENVLAFSNAFRYEGPHIELMISTDYTGAGDPHAATWSNITYRANWDTNPDSWDWYPSGDIDISDFVGDNVHVAFVYHSNPTWASTWTIDDLSITGIPEPGLFLLPLMALFAFWRRI